MRILCAGIVFFLASRCFAATSMPSGYEWGNGGFFASCPADSFVGGGVFSVDRLEGQHLHGFSVDASLLKMQNEDEIIREVLQRLESANPSRARLYKKWLSEIYESREFIENFFFMPLPDSGSTMIPDGCKQEQAAIFIVSPNSPSESQR